MQKIMGKSEIIFSKNIFCFFLYFEFPYPFYGNFIFEIFYGKTEICRSNVKEFSIRSGKYSINEKRIKSIEKNFYWKKLWEN